MKKLLGYKAGVSGRTKEFENNGRRGRRRSEEAWSRIRCDMILENRTFDWLVRSEGKYDWLRGLGAKNHREHQFETQIQSHFLGSPRSGVMFSMIDL